MKTFPETGTHQVCWQLMGPDDYPRALVEAALRQSIRAQQWVLDACAELGIQHVHVQPPRGGDELGTPRNPYTVWNSEGSSELLVSYYLAVTDACVELNIVEGRRADGRLWTRPEFGPAYRSVIQAAHKTSS
jgi:hypothetical protein